MNLYDIINENYNVVSLVDCYDNNEIYGTILLNKKHSIEEFQDAIYKAKDKYNEDIQKYGDDWSFIQQGLEDFDYFEIGDGDYWVEY